MDENKTEYQFKEYPINPLATISHDIRDKLIHTGVYTAPLSSLVSKVVASPRTQVENIKQSIGAGVSLEEELLGAFQIDDWERSLHIEANNQFSSKYRPMVEIVLNAIDTQTRKQVITEEAEQKTVDIEFNQDGFRVTDKGEGMDLDEILAKLLVPKLTGNTNKQAQAIGRFGVGFYSLLSYLKNEDDSITVTTQKGNEKHIVTITKNHIRGSESGKYQIAIQPISRLGLVLPGIDEGTIVEVHTSDFDQTTARDYLNSTLRFKEDATIVADGQVINQPENFHQNQISINHPNGQESKVRILESTNTSDKAQLLLTVGGVKVEQFTVQGVELPETLVIDLPSNIQLPKSRDQIEVNAEAVELLSGSINSILFNRPPSKAATIISTLLPVIKKLQQRNRSSLIENNLVAKLRNSVDSWAKTLPTDTYLIPSYPGLEQIELNGAILIHPELYTGHTHIPGSIEEKQFVAIDKKIYWTTFNTDEIMIVTPSSIFLNEKYQAQNPAELGLLAAYFESHNKSQTDSKLKISYFFRQPYMQSDRQDEIKSQVLETPLKSKTEPISTNHESVVIPETFSELIKRSIRSNVQKYISRLLYNRDASFFGIDSDSFHTFPQELASEEFIQSLTSEIINLDRDSVFKRRKEYIATSENFISLYGGDFNIAFNKASHEEVINILREIIRVNALHIPTDDNLRNVFYMNDSNKAMLESFLEGRENSDYTRQLIANGLPIIGITPGDDAPLELIFKFATDRKISYIFKTEQQIQLIHYILKNELELTNLNSNFQAYKKAFSQNKIYFDSNEFIFSELYLYGAGQNIEWDSISENLEMLSNFFNKAKINNIRSHIFHSEWAILCSGKFNPQNLQMIADKLVDIPDVSQMPYLEFALGFTHLPSKAFNQIHQLLINAYTEDLLPDDPVYKLNLYRIITPFYFDNTETIQARFDLLSKLPAQCTRTYYSLFDTFTEWVHSPINNFEQKFLRLDKKLRTIFYQMSKMPIDELEATINGFNQILSNGNETSAILEANVHNNASLNPNIKAFVSFLASDLDLPETDLTEYLNGETVEFHGSNLVAHYFTNGLTGINNLTELEQIVSTPSVGELTTLLAQRRIEHAINYQSKNGHVWLRELVQNAYNATREHPDEKQVKIDGAVSRDNLVITVTDPLGMSLNRIINSLLIPQKSEWGKGSLGYFGQGFFTVLQDANEVRIKTSSGNGIASYITILPIRGNDQIIKDIQIRIGQKPENFQGTEVNWIRSTENPELLAQYVRNELITYTGMIPTTELEILWQGEKVNSKEIPKLASRQTSFGEVQLYFTQGQGNAITQNNLFITALDDEIAELIVPDSIKTLLLKHGISIDLPPAIRLLDSRNNIVAREDVLPELRKVLSQASIEAAAKLFVTGYIKLDTLPDDYIEKIFRYEPRDPQLLNDANILSRGEPLEDWSRYIENDGKATELLLTVPTIEVSGEKLSIFQIVSKAKSDREFRKQLPYSIVKRIEDDIAINEHTRLRMSNDFLTKGFEAVDVITADMIPDSADTYRAWLELSHQLIEPAINQFGAEYKEDTFTSNSDNFIARTSSYIGIQWNIYHDFGKYALILSNILLNKEVNDQSIYELYLHLAEVSAHEYQHIRDRKYGEDDLTHNNLFFSGQKQIVAEMIRKCNLDAIQDNLRSHYTGTFIEPVEFSKLFVK